MSAKPETVFTKSVHKYLPHTYYEKTNNPFRSGIADVWYSGHEGDLWVEYKFVESLPRTKEYRPNLSERQFKWLRDRHSEGRNVAVILGTRAGGIVYWNLGWELHIAPAELLQTLRTRPELAQWIISHVGTSPCKFPSSHESPCTPPQ